MDALAPQAAGFNRKDLMDVFAALLFFAASFLLWAAAYVRFTRGSSERPWRWR